jgi:hypothetical protein
MAQNGGLYMRRSLKDSKTLQGNPAAAASPDIIPYGQIPPANPEIFFRANYGEDVGQPITRANENLIFVRARNTEPGTAKGSVFLHYVESAMVLFPQDWSHNIVKTVSGADHVNIGDTQPGEIGVGVEPFAWRPPAGDKNYCFVSLLAAGADLPRFSEQEQMTSRNVFYVDANEPSLAWPVSYDQGPVGGAVLFYAVCVNCPANRSWVSFSSTTAIPGGAPVSIPKTLIDHDPLFCAGTERIVPAEWKTRFNFRYERHGPPLPGWEITLAAAMVDAPEKHEALYKSGHTAEELEWGNGIHVAENGGQTSLVQALGGKKLILLGQCVLRHGTGL